MKFVGEISQTTWAGRKITFGFRYRCQVPRCPAVETVMLDETGEETKAARTQK
jgi:hypothetical protein